MKRFLKSNVLLLGFGLCLLAFLTFWALTTGQCFEFKSGQTEIKASCYPNAKDMKNTINKIK